jgi:glutamyl-tRNA reductase
MDYLSQLTDETLENRKRIFLQLKLYWKQLEEFNVWTKVESLHQFCLKRKAQCDKTSELDFQKQKISDNLEQAEIISAKSYKK